MLSPGFGEMCSNIERCVFRALSMGALFIIQWSFFMENNFNQDEKQELKERAKRKLQQMSTVEKADCVRKEKKRTYWWLGISLFCCIAWISAIFTNLNAPSDTSNNPIGALVIATIVGATISIFMIIKLSLLMALML